ncbi:DUF1189 domain-containing protein [Alkalihalophilus pseudofirmus]|uniref:DUF1189 domain-containing protein n=1 Tax=Alkalihalophilus pseudofirmus TaxID=79885 RepID=A0AAJ2KZR8_ALKPS|nr:DUF1189 domain-containing protein [Alkalihalophilus pseudofirmus]MDV2884024.1 DUF1189 domain-containing protein [Alkalihalophilus pseudofirmus]
MNAFQFFYKSLFDKKVIAYSRFQPITKALLHVLMVVFIACIPFIVSLIMTYVSSINQLEESLENDMPAFSLRDGELQAEVDEPYVNESLSEGVFVLDPNNQLTTQDLEQLGEGIIFQQNEALLFRYGSTHSVNYSLIGLQEVSDTELNERLTDIKGFLPFLLAIISLLMYSGVLGLAFLGITILAFVALLFRGTRKNIQYRHMWLITAYAMTLPVILFAWADVFIGGIPGYLLVLAVVCMIVYALSAIPKPKQKTK